MSSVTERVSTETSQRPARNHQPSTAELVKQATEQVSRLIRDELRLLRAEMTAKRKKLAMGAGMLGAAGLLALYGLGALVASAILVLAIVLPAWLSALIVTAALFVLAGLLALIGRSRVKKATPPMPEETKASVMADIDEIKTRAQS